MEYLSYREIQLAELDILHVFDQICREHKLRYSLAGGSLLGAIRHRGFIPWDDDIDVCMPRPDYEKLLLLFHNNISERYYLSQEAEKVQYPFIKILDKRIRVERKGIDDVQNLWIDVFPVDGLPSDEKKIKKIYKKNKLYIKIICFSMWKNLKSYQGRQNKIKALFIKLFVKLYGSDRAKRKLEALAKKYKYEDSKYVGAVTWGCYGIGERMLKSEYEKLVEVEFEGHTFKAMSCWDSYLTGIYGDYMQLPPEDKRVCHSFKAYRIEENE